MTAAVKYPLINSFSREGTAAAPLPVQRSFCFSLVACLDVYWWGWGEKKEEGGTDNEEEEEK